MKKLLPFLLGVIFFVGCKPKSDTPAPVDPLVALQEKAEAIAAQQVPIEATEVPQSRIKSTIITFLSGQQTGVMKYDLQYNDKNQLISILKDSELIWNLDLEDKQATISYSGLTRNYTLNSDGRGEKATETYEAKFKDIQYIYKNGYWVSAYGTDGTLTTRVYSREGDLLQVQVVDQYGQVKHDARYQYTDIPNAIRQEVDRWEAPHFAFRSDILGRYSQHLLKEAVINGTHTLTFDYKMDNKNRVGNVTITRTQGSFQLPKVFYSYLYE